MNIDIKERDGYPYKLTLTREDRPDLCKKHPGCDGCPQDHKDFCEGTNFSRRLEKERAKDYRRLKWDGIIKEMSPCFKNIIPFGNDGYKLVLPNGYVYHYYPTTELLINMYSKRRVELDINYFEKYFSFLKKQ